MIKEQSMDDNLNFEGVTKKTKQNKSLKQEIMTTQHRMICGNCSQTTDMTTLVREEYLNGLTYGTFPVYCEHCGSERRVILDFSE